MARYLYNKNRSRTAHYCYQQTGDELIAVNIAPNGRTRIILIGHGRFMQALGGKRIVSLLVNKGLLKKTTNGLFSTVEHVSIAAGYITEAAPAGVSRTRLPTKPIIDIPPDAFIDDLYRAFSTATIPVGSISVREKLVAVDMLGRKWSGEPINPNAPQNKWQINWVLVKESDRKLIFIQQEDGAIVSEQISRVEKSPMRRRRLRTSYLGRFGVDHLMQVTAGQTTRLNGYVDEAAAIHITEELKKGAVLLAADSMALIAGMSEHYLRYNIIINADEPNMAALQQALWQTQNHDDYKTWLTGLKLAGGEKVLTARIKKCLPIRKPLWSVSNNAICVMNLIYSVLILAILIPLALLNAIGVRKRLLRVFIWGKSKNYWIAPLSKACNLTIS